MTLARSVIAGVHWSSVEVLRGSGPDLAQSLTRFVEAETPERASDLWWELEGSAFAQNTIYGGAEPTVGVMLAALADRPPAFLRSWIIEVLRFILSGESDDDPSLSSRCLENARSGVWLLATEICEADDPTYAAAVMEVLELIDASHADIVKRCRQQGAA